MTPPRRSVPACQVLARVEASARRHPRRRAIVGPETETSYADLREAIHGWRNRLADRSLPVRSIVAILTGGEADLPAAFLGARAAGLVPLLLDTVSHRRPAALLSLIRASALVDLEDGGIAPVEPGPPRILPPEAGYVVFSSGSQGMPKGIVGLARGLVHFVEWEVEKLGVGGRTSTALLTSPSFDVVFRDLLLPLLAGGELHVAGRAVRTSARRVLPWLAERGVEVLHLVPSLSTRWVEAAAGATMPELRWSVFAGEPLFDRHVGRWRGVAPRSRVLNLYGPAETTLAKFAYLVPDVPVPGLQPVGRPLPDTSLLLEPLSDGDEPVSSVTIETPHGSLGYLPGTASDGDRVRLRRKAGLTRFRTRDRGRLDARGNLVVEGRLDSLVKRRGTFVDTSLVEAAATDLDEVRVACCVQVDADRTGRIVLAVEQGDGAPPAGLRRMLLRRLAPDMLPDEVISLPRIPLLSSGKVDRQLVRSQLEAAGSVDAGVGD